MSNCRWETLNERLRKIDDRIAQVDRRLGDLTARVYYRLPGTDFARKQQHFPWCEIPIWEFTDTALANDGAGGEDFMPEQKERTLDVKVNKTWILEHRDKIQRYEFSVVYERQTEHKLCSLMGFAASDKDTHGRLQLREVLLYSNHN